MTDPPEFDLRSASTPDRLMEELEKFIAFWIGPRREEYGEPEGRSRRLPAAQTAPSSLCVRRSLD